MSKTKIIFIKDIVNNSYKKWSQEKKGWAKTLNKRLIQVERWDDNQIKYFKINFKSQMKLHIKSELNQEINKDVEKIISLRKSTKKDSNEKKLAKEIYGWLYKYVDNKIEEHIGNPIHHLKIIFTTKKELKEKIFASKEISLEKKEKLINYAWANLK